MTDLAKWLDTPGAGLVLLVVGLGVLSGVFGGFTVLDALQTISRAQAHKYGVSWGGNRSGDDLLQGAPDRLQETGSPRKG